MACGWEGKHIGLHVGLASHWPCVTDFSGLSDYGLMISGSKMSTPPTLIMGYGAHFTFTCTCSHCGVGRSAHVLWTRLGFLTFTAWRRWNFESIVLCSSVILLTRRTALEMLLLLLVVVVVNTPCVDAAMNGETVVNGDEKQRLASAKEMGTRVPVELNTRTNLGRIMNKRQF